MPSPFPGMDPYLESHWGDAHHSFIPYARDQLRELLPADLRARIEERVFVESPEGAERPPVPDLRIAERGRGKGKRATPANGPAVAEPLIIPLDDPTTQGYIEIRDTRSGMRVVTVIEVLSPSNKVPGDGQDKYLQKQRELCEGRVSLVEIDLVRSGKRLLPVPLERLPEEYRTPYQVCVRRGWQLASVEIYRVPLSERLPIIKVPLRQTDKDVPLDLRAVLEQCYRNGGYEEDLDYRADPEPPLEGEDARRADELLRQAGLRGRRKRRTGGPRKKR
jgi:hypothetical protein